MTLSSVVFIFCFLPILLAVYHAIPSGGLVAKKALLLAASILFFSWSAQEYLPFLLLVVVFNYAAALLLDKQESLARRMILAVGIALNVLALAYYKYFDFFGELLSGLLGFEYVEVGFIQPLGISFLVFSQISYLMDVYRKDIPADRNILDVALWSCFFPKITSGPIVRYADMKPDLQAEKIFKLDDLAYGVRRFVIGFAKKVIIADSLGVVVDSIFAAQYLGIDTPTAWLGIICYTFQIFFDFAGYSDMAIGLAAMFGYRFKENFMYPYAACTLGEFWHRWHISLSTWLRDYLYFPLGGSRRGNVYVNLMIVFLVSGLWHGADWHYVAWGAWYGVFMIADRIYRQKFSHLKIPRVVLWAATMLVVVLGWVFFRAVGMHQSITYLALLFGFGAVDTQFFGLFYYLNAQLASLLLIAALCASPLFMHMRQRYEDTVAWGILRMVCIPVLFVLAVLYMVNSTYSPFLYAQF